MVYLGKNVKTTKYNKHMNCYEFKKGHFDCEWKADVWEGSGAESFDYAEWCVQCLLIYRFSTRGCLCLLKTEIHNHKETSCAGAGARCCLRVRYTFRILYNLVTHNITFVVIFETSNGVLQLFCCERFVCKCSHEGLSMAIVQKLVFAWWQCLTITLHEGLSTVKAPTIMCKMISASVSQGLSKLNNSSRIIRLFWDISTHFSVS